MSEDGSDFPSQGLGSVCSRTWLFGSSSPAVFIVWSRRSQSVLRPTSKPVVREGLGSAVRLGARGTQRLTYRWRLTLEPERLKNPTDHRPERSQGMERIPEALKLFVVSDVGRRSRLLSSRRSM